MQYQERLNNGRPARAENETFSWFWGLDGYLHHKPSGRSIYQMRWPDDSRVECEIAAAAVEFWNALYAEQANAETAHREAQMAAYLAASEARRPQDARKAALYDRVQNEGGEGFNPYRD